MSRLTRNQIIILIVAGVLLFVIGTFALLGITGVVILTRPQPTSTPTATITPEPSPTEEGMDSWLRIKQAGKIVVGTSADYPPFAYYTTDFKLEGFDLALIRAIGERLGVEVVIKDMAFDGLGGALQLGQIDVAIAAISVTPERDLVLDFSTVYFVSEDAALAREDVDIAPIETVEELARYRVGVQRGSVYEDWLRTELVEMGKMPEGDLLVFQLIDQALGNLGEGRIDLVVMDALPAETFAQQGGVKVVARSLNRQRYAMAVNQEDTSLLDELNRALKQLQDEGRVAELVKDYLGLESGPAPAPEPTPTPAPTQPPLPERCIDGMELLQHLSYPDANMTNPPVVPPGTPFEKGWRIRNSGTCAWKSSYILSYMGGNLPASHMGGQPTRVLGEVPPGATYDMYVSLFAPPIVGVYQGFWELHNEEGNSFGERIWVGIRVPPDAPPPLTQTPAPGISFSADITQIKPGERVIFNWRVTNAKAVYFYAQGQDWRAHPVSFSGSSEEYPSLTTIYELRVVKSDNTAEVRQIIVYVEQDEDAPVITKFTVDPEGRVEIGKCVNISWTVDGNISTVNLLANGNILWGEAPFSGTYQDCPTEPGVVTVELRAIGPDGTSQQQRLVEVIQPDEPPSPSITNFTVSPETIQAGDCVDLSWIVENASQVQILRNGGLYIENAPLSGGQQDCIETSGVIIYRLEARNEADQVTAEELSVTVNPD